MKPLSTQGAILVGSAVISAGLGFGVYFASRQVSAARPSVATGQPGIPQQADVLRVSEPSTPTVSTLALGQAAGADEVSAYLAREKRRLVQRCWDPAHSSTVKSAHFRLHLLLDAEGQELGHSFLEDGASLPGAAQCLNMALGPVKIRPSGARSTVEVPFEVP